MTPDSLEHVRGHLERLTQLIDEMPADRIEAIGELLFRRTGREHVFVVGNGGSAATASHMASDLEHDGPPDRPGSGS